VKSKSHRAINSRCLLCILQLEIEKDILGKLGRFMSMEVLGILPWSKRMTKPFLYCICYLGGNGRGCYSKDMQE
jgi:hypothetical protein